MPSGFEFSPTDCTDNSDHFFSFFFDALFDFVKNRATDLHRFFTRCASYIRTSLASARSPTVNPEGVIDHRRGCKPPVEIPPYTNPEGVAEIIPSGIFCSLDDTQSAIHSALPIYVAATRRRIEHK